MPTPPDAQVFIVRIWRRFAPFKASVRRVDEAQIREFRAPDELASYLAHAAETPGEESPGAGAGSEHPAVSSDRQAPAEPDAPE